MIRKRFSRIVEKLAKYLASPDCGEDAVGHMLEDVGDGVPELASGERVDNDYFFLSWSCCESLKNTWRIICRRRKCLHASVMR